MKGQGGRLSGTRWNRILDHGLSWYKESVENLKDAIEADGFVPFSEPLSPVEQWQRLTAMKAAGDPRYWQDPEAQKAYARLGMRFASPEPLLPMPPGSYPGGGPL